ncbi:MAG: hypothetical protein Q9216_005335 [Gyalolechia sp. 2 TL-2023]
MYKPPTVVPKAQLLTWAAMFPLFQLRIQYVFSIQAPAHCDTEAFVSLEQDPDATSSVHEIYINWAPGVIPRQESATNTTLMYRLTYLIPDLTSLKRLIWDAQCGIPPALYDKLARYSPFCELYTRCPLRNDTARSLQLLQDCTQLVALEVILDPTQYHALLELRKVLTACQNLETLQVSCPSFPTAPSAGFGSTFSLSDSNEQLPPLKILKLQEMTLADYSKDGWERCIRWEALERLHCTEIGFFAKMPACLRQLRSLEIHLSNENYWTNEQGDAVLEVASTSSNLEELCMTGMTDFLRTRNFLSRSKVSLKHLKIHENQVYGEGAVEVRSTLCAEEIVSLGNSFPRLERCSIDLQVGSDWVSVFIHSASSIDYITKINTLQPWSTLSRIAESLWFIVELELNLELHIPEAGPTHPVATLQSVFQIWHFIWRKIENVRRALNHITCRPRLQTLRISEGSYRQEWDIPRAMMRQERGEQAIFEARLSERDDLAEYGYAVVTCLSLEALRNKYGREPQEDQAKAGLMEDVLYRAEHGPAQMHTHIDLGNQMDMLRPLRTPLLALADAN